MNLSAIMDEVASVLGEITGLNVFAYPPATLSPPAGYVSYPASVDFDAAYGRGVDRITGLPIALLAGEPTEPSTRDQVATWAAGAGGQSVKARMEAHTWTSCDDLTVTSCSFDVETVAGVDYLAAAFTADIIGSGRE
ncbi:hypothetical protein [Actinoplanes awajinensis]|uniref:Uncharacterized protein n=1 Tax=Actinoplanes awajinensis subsp. mycoplanecinus TaxID=135947 RepID=A0A101J8V1_9ACTN|nr:hypothetical protein [Actinoplanes awajinensis]KUL22353.1 hypothetical protein ADL15_48335 [Actinoplanes awajinensis subsp. mycoplanecinus]